MKRYVSLGSAMMMGFVASHAKETFEFENALITGMHKPYGTETPNLQVDAVAEEDATKLKANEDPDVPVHGYNDGYSKNRQWENMQPLTPTVI